MTWLKDGRLACSEHPRTLFDYPGPRRLLIDAARAAGWAVFDGTTIGGDEMQVHLCSECTHRRRESLTKKMIEDVPLWTDGEL